jgi:hypothetical protein
MNPSGAVDDRATGTIVAAERRDVGAAQWRLLEPYSTSAP